MLHAVVSGGNYSPTFETFAGPLISAPRERLKWFQITGQHHRDRRGRIKSTTGRGISCALPARTATATAGAVHVIEPWSDTCPTRKADGRPLGTCPRIRTKRLKAGGAHDRDRRIRVYRYPCAKPAAALTALHTRVAGCHFLAARPTGAAPRGVAAGVWDKRFKASVTHKLLGDVGRSALLCTRPSRATRPASALASFHTSVTGSYLLSAPQTCAAPRGLRTGVWDNRLKARGTHELLSCGGRNPRPASPHMTVIQPGPDNQSYSPYTLTKYVHAEDR